jgi:DNA (cytosine-5)-methyltransferase 1
MARLHGFPDWFRFHATKWNGARQIGNAVPPPLARAIAKQVIAAAGITPRRPAEIQELGSPALLEMDMSQASAYWKVPVPIGRRDRKSGTHKRKQEEIEALMQRELKYA